MEITPPVKQKRDRFLTVLKPALAGRTNPSRVVPLNSESMLGCRLISPDRKVNLHFPSDREGVSVRFEGGRQLDLTVPRR